MADDEKTDRLPHNSPDAQGDIAGRKPNAHADGVNQPIIQTEIRALVLTGAEAQNGMQRTHDLA
jgi:hypothetical protein